MGNISKNFSDYEFACQHCGLKGINNILVQALQKLRDQVGVSIKVSSGFRCPNHPLSKKNPTSQHAQGKAADICISGMDVKQMYEAAKLIPEFAFGGIGLYDQNFIHVDVRDGKARWGRIKGKYVGIDEFFDKIR